MNTSRLTPSYEEVKFRVRVPVRGVPVVPNEVISCVVQVRLKVGWLLRVTVPLGDGVVIIDSPRIVPLMVERSMPCPPAELELEKLILALVSVLVLVPRANVPDTPV